MRIAVALGCALVVAVLAEPAAAAPLTATKIRIGDHAAFVRVVVVFTGGRVQTGEVVATDPDPFPDGFVRLPLTHAGVRSTAPLAHAHGVFVRIAHAPGRIAIRLRGAHERFKYAGYFALRSPERLVVDLYKSRPPSAAAESTRGRGGCLTLDQHTVTRSHVTAAGDERGLFEHSLVVRLRRTEGGIHRQKAVTATAGRWTASFTYPMTLRQTGTLEAVALSAKDGTLDCLVQVRVRFGGS